MPYPARERKQPDMFQAFEAGDKHAPGSARVKQARMRKKDRVRKSGPRDGEVCAKKSMKEAAKKKGKPDKKKDKPAMKVDKLVIKIKLRKKKMEEAKKNLGPK